MPVIHLQTFIEAPVETVFDMSRSVDLHKSSMKHHNEEAVAGVTKGLMKKGDTVTWQAKHLFRTRKLKVTITEMTSPTFFADEMLEGDFKMMRHEHYFHPQNKGTLMVDKFSFESPFGIMGKLVNAVFLKKYMTQLLLQRNSEIKRMAENHL
ncbi:MAG TPA: SRPBCC family protein [Flavisolibacter sp.]|nr:SRPBCC family protein [Flavisolibacter sp.]